MQTFDADSGTPVNPQTPADTRPTVDLAPCHFGGTFQNPCFWILLGIGGTILAQYLLRSRKSSE